MLCLVNGSSPDLLEEADLRSAEWLKNYPKSECGSKCLGWSIRRYKQDKCCWDCDPCAYPLIKVNETHCESCTIDMDRQIFTKPNQWRNACITVFDSPHLRSIPMISDVENYRILLLFDYVHFSKFK